MNVLIDKPQSQLKKNGGVKRFFNGLFKQDFFKLSDSKGDIFHSNYYSRHQNYNIPQVVTVYDMIDELFPEYSLGLRKRLFRWRKKRVIRAADALICISENTKKDVLKFYKLNPKKIYVVYPGVDNNFKKITDNNIKRRFLKKHRIKKPYLLYVGTRGRYKNFLGLVKAYSQWIKRNDFDLVCVGGPKFHQEREIAYFKQLNLINKIHHFTDISDKDLALFYNYAHAFIYPSLYEGFGIPLVEAMVCGTLVICSNTSSFPEVVKDCGIYFNPESQESMLNALDKSLNNKLRKILVKKGLQRVKYFTWEKTAGQTLKIYKRVLQTKQ